MRKSTTIVLGMTLLATLPLGAKVASPFKIFDHVKAAKASETMQKAPDARMKVSEVATKFKPTVVKTYGWTGRKWLMDETINYTYDITGNPINEKSVDAEGDYVNAVYEYDANGKVTYKESKVSSDGVSFENYKKTRFEYDPILTNVITKRTEWLWMNIGKGYDWQLVSNNYERRITRNDDGNVTSVVIAVLFNGEYDPTQRIDIAYGENGEAISISEQILNYDGKDFYWDQGLKITDIKWEITDGQIYDTEMLFVGKNKIKSCHYYDTDAMDVDVTAEYADGSDGYKVTMVGSMEGLEVEAKTEYIPLENDSYIEESTISVMGEVVYTHKVEEQYDEWGYLLLSSDMEIEDGDIEDERMIGVVEYDEAGFPTSYTVSEEEIDYATGKTESEYVFRAEYFDYVDVTTAVSEMEVRQDAPVRYYNLQGVPVEKPVKGMILIKKQGCKTLKSKY